MNSQQKCQPSKSRIVEVTAILAKTTIKIKRTTRITMKDGIILESSPELPITFQPFKSNIVEVTAVLAKTTMATLETTRTTRITMQDGIILESSHELPKKISAV